MENDKKWLLIGGIILLLILYPNIKSLLSEKFVISDSDLDKQTEVTLSINQSYNSIQINSIGPIISFSYPGAQGTIPSGSSFYMLDDLANIYLTIPNMTDGQHTLTRYQMFALNNNTQVNLQVWSKTLYISTKIEGPVVYRNQTITETVYVDKWTNGTKTVYVNNTVYQDKVVEKLIEPTLDSTLKLLWAKYKIYIIVLALFIAYYYNENKGKKK